MSQDFLSEGRTKVLRRLLYVTLALAGVVALIGVILLVAHPQRYVITLLVIAAAYAVSGGLALRAVQRREDSAKLMCVITAIVLIVLSLPLASILVGLLTVVAGVGLLVVVVAPEREAR